MLGLGLGLAVGIAALGVGIGQGIAANGALSGMARQPEASGKIQTGMLIALAFMELVFLLTFVVALILQGKLPAGG
jgi:F-type H+-transporting ATPase subunit c